MATIDGAAALGLRVCVYGAGAIGGHLAAKLAAAGNDTSVLARGATLGAIRSAGGLLLRVGEQRLFGPLRASDRATDLGVQDVVIVALKATALGVLAGRGRRDGGTDSDDGGDGIGPLLGPDTAVVFVQNGIPWWYANGLSPRRPRPPAELRRLDPGGRLAAAVAPGQVVGATIYTSNEVVAPGVIENDSATANTLIVGEPGDEQTPRIRRLRAALVAAGIGSPPTDDIRATLWRRLLVNIAGSVVCSIIEQPVGAAQADAGIAALYDRLTAESTAVAAAHGVDVAAGTVPDGAPHRFPPHHKPSFLQDYERRRPMEIDAILQLPLAFARSAGIAVPAMETVAALAACRAAGHGLYTAP